MMNPSDKSCFVLCFSCYRCHDKGRWGAKCAECSGRHDPESRFTPDRDDFCQCSEGILRYKTQDGRRILRRFSGNPFNNPIRTPQETQDERDYQSYLNSQREKQDDQHWDPVRFTDGTSTDAWYKKQQGR